MEEPVDVNMEKRLRIGKSTRKDGVEIEKFLQVEKSKTT